MVLSRRASLFLLAVGAWSWVIWPTFLRNIWRDPRSFDQGPQPFFIVHAALVAVSLVIGTSIGTLGVRGLLAHRHSGDQRLPLAVGADGESTVAPGRDAEVGPR